MKKILFLNTIQDKAWKNRALFLMLALVVSMGNVYAATYTSTMNVAGSPTGVGSVYVSDQSGATSGNQKLSKKSEGQTSAPDHTYYIYANASQGYYFKEWTATANITLGNNSESSTTAEIEAGKNDGTSGTATAIFKPNVKITGASAEEIHATFNPAEDSQADKTCVAVFNVENAESIADFVAPTIGGEDSDKFLYQSMSYTNNKVTISFVYNGNKEAGDHTATLTLKVIDQKGGTDQTYGSKTITLIAHNEQEAVNEVSVTTAGGVTTEYATWAEGLAVANANAGCTLTLLRNIDLGTITTTNSITKAMTIDLNGKELRAAVNKASVGLLTLNAAVEVTIKDSKTGGKIQNIADLNGALYAINVGAGATLNVESGYIYVENQSQYAYGTSTYTDGTPNISNMQARGIHMAATSKVNVSGGKIHAVASCNAFGIREESSKANNTVLTITGGEIIGEAPRYAYGIYAGGKVNISGGTVTALLNDKTVNGNTTYTANNWGDYTLHRYGYGIQMFASSNATAANCYFGTLTITGGTINAINVNKTLNSSSAVQTEHTYGIMMNYSMVGAGAGKTAPDGSKVMKASAIGSIENATINVTHAGSTAYGIMAYGTHNSFDNTTTPLQIKNTTINVEAFAAAYGIYANAYVNWSASLTALTGNGGCTAGEFELTNTTINATTTGGAGAYCAWAGATSGTVANAKATTGSTSTGNATYYGEYAVAGKITVNSGTYTANAATSSAYGIGSTDRVKTVRNVNGVFANRDAAIDPQGSLGGAAEAYPELYIHGGSFSATTGTTTAVAVKSGGNTLIDGGTFNAYAGGSTAYGLYVTAGKTVANGVTFPASATTVAYGVYVFAAISDWSLFPYAGEVELNNCNVTATARTTTDARGVYVHGLSKVYTQASFDAMKTANSSNYKNYGDYAQVGERSIVGKATINNCTIKAKATTTKAYAVHSAAKQIQGEKETAPSIVINSGKFWSEATSDYADISPECVPGYCIVKGGYYKNDAYITPVLDEGYNVFALQQNKEEHETAYNEGYRWHVTNGFTGEVVCKVTHGSTTKIYDKLESAFNYVNNTMASNEAATIILCANYTLPAGNYTIPSNVTLLIPYDDAYTANTASPTTVKADASPKDPSLYRKLTLEDGVNIVVQDDGNICVNAKILSGNTTAKNVCGRVTGGYGLIDMMSGSSITLSSGANLYCWGYVIGEGTIEAQSEAHVYEPFQFADFRGGTASVSFLYPSSCHKIFPYSQYYVQNIEVPITFYAGAKETLFSGFITTKVFGDGNDETTFAPKFVGSDGLFNITSGQLTKYYDKDKDRLVCIVDGTLVMQQIEISITNPITSKQHTISSEDYVLPITNNLTININSGTTIVNAEAAFLAGTSTYIAKDATLQFKKTTYIYDRDNWVSGQYVYGGSGNQSYFRPLHYSGSGGTSIKTKRTDDNLLDAVIDVNGTLEIEDALYTTGTGTEPNLGGADICSSKGTGIIQLTKGAVTEPKITYQATQSGSDIAYSEIPITAAQLHNDEIKNPDYHYTQTSGAVAGDEFIYSEYYGRWLQNPKVITWDATTNGGTCETLQTVLPPGTTVPELPIATKIGYTFNGWFTDASGGTQVTTGTIVDNNVTYYAQWTLNIVDPPLDIVDADNTNQTLTINATSFALSGWSYTINGTPYEKTARKADRTLVIPYSGQPNNDMLIEVKDTEGTVVSCHMYKVPFVYTGTEEMSDMNENSIVFVKSDTLSIEGIALAKEIYVAPGATLQVNGRLTVGKLVLRTTPYKAAVLTIETGGSIALTEGGQVFYSRISPGAEQYYQFGLPLSCALANVKMSNTGKLGGSQPKYGTAWMLKSYSESSRANNGIKDKGANWNLLPSDGTITAGVGYEMFSNSNYYREFYFPVDLTTATNKVSVRYTGGTISAEHNGWNIITSPLTSRATVTIGDPATAFKVCWLDSTGSYRQKQDTVIPPAIPFSIQASAEGELNFAVPTIAAAPRKQSAAEALTETEWIHLDIFDAYGEGDETSLFVHPTRFEQTYKTGIDMAKQSLTASRPIIYSTHAYGDMAFAGVADSLLENGIDIAVYSPSAQQLTFSLRENKFLHRLEYLWLADNETGERTDLLMDDYTCRANAGTIKGRFVLNGRFKAPQITTNIDNIHTDYTIYAIGNNIAISGVEQGTPIYVFDAVGHMIYTTAATSDEVIVPAPCAGVYMLTIGGQTAKLVVNQ